MNDIRRRKRLKALWFFTIGILFFAAMPAQEDVDAAYRCLDRIIQKESRTIFELKIRKDKSKASYFDYGWNNGKIRVTAATPVDLIRGAYDYLANACHSMVSWSGNRIVIPDRLPHAAKTAISPFPLRYSFNVVTHGYSTVYWDWQRWEKELDWLAVHGINMPLLPGAHEAILKRVFEKLGLTKDEIGAYFTGPAHFPWNRMGNIAGWDGPPPDTFFTKQVRLFHQILKRAKEFGMHPIIPAFAGFVPPGIRRLFPEEKLRELKYGSFDRRYQACILDPSSELFHRIGKDYIREWQKEFGEEEYYLGDCFNEMTPPLPEDPAEALTELAAYGRSVYRSIASANPNAIWVMQGWTFPYYRDGDKHLFWTPERLQAMLSGVPDEKALVLDVTNEYSRLWWNTEPSWKMYDGFFGKQWVFAYIPNMGGHVPYNGRLDVYASMSTEALRYKDKGRLVGFGFAPEGVENNDIVYELLSDMAWQTQPIDLDSWIERYCIHRYGSFPKEMKTAYHCFNKSVFGNFTDDAIYRYQFGPVSRRRASVCGSEYFGRGVGAFLACKDLLKNSHLYRQDLIEVVTQFLGVKADDLIARFTKETRETDYGLLDEAMELLKNIDRLYESHSTHRLQNWIAFARGFGDTKEEKDYYESNAKRLITTWGGGENMDYSARSWSGLIRDYYVPRWSLYYEAKRKGERFDLSLWEERWIATSGISKIEPFEDPLESACELFGKYAKPEGTSGTSESHLDNKH